MPILGTSNIIAKEIDDVGDTVTVRSVTKTIDDWGDSTETVLDASGILAIIRVMSETEDLVKEGIFQVGDVVFYFKGTTSNIIRGNRIIWNSKTYEIVDAIPYYSKGRNYLTEARAKVV